jgi:hypothetical protein
VSFSAAFRIGAGLNMLHTWFMEQNVHAPDDEAMDDETIVEQDNAREQETVWVPLRCCDQLRLESVLCASQAKSIALEFSGKLGLTIDPNGVVEDVHEGLAERAGVQVGWQLLHIGGENYSQDLLRETIMYCVKHGWLLLVAK